MQNAAPEGTALELQSGGLDNSAYSTSPASPATPRPSDIPGDDRLDIALECWAQRLLARTILYADGEFDLQTAVDRAWDAAVAAGLVDAFGVDEIQSAMALAFRAVRP